MGSNPNVIVLRLCFRRTRRCWMTRPTLKSGKDVRFCKWRWEPGQSRERQGSSRIRYLDGSFLPTAVVLFEGLL